MAPWSDVLSWFYQFVQKNVSSYFPTIDIMNKFYKHAFHEANWRLTWERFGTLMMPSSMTYTKFSKFTNVRYELENFSAKAFFIKLQIMEDLEGNSYFGLTLQLLMTWSSYHNVTLRSKINPCQPRLIWQVMMM